MRIKVLDNSFAATRKRNTSIRQDDLFSTVSPSSEVGKHGGGREQPSFWAIIQFQLSSKACEEKGWIVHPDDGKEPDVESILHTIIHVLQISMKQRYYYDNCVVRYIIKYV